MLQEADFGEPTWKLAADKVHDLACWSGLTDHPVAAGFGGQFDVMSN